MLLAIPLNGSILEQLFDGPKRLVKLRSHSGSAPEATVRAHLKELDEVIGAISKRGREGSPGVAEYALTGAGTDLLGVIAALEQWLLNSPEGPLRFDSDGGKSRVLR